MHTGAAISINAGEEHSAEMAQNTGDLLLGHGGTAGLPSYTIGQPS